MDLPIFDFFFFFFNTETRKNLHRIPYFKSLQIKCKVEPRYVGYLFFIMRNNLISNTHKYFTEVQKFLYRIVACSYSLLVPFETLLYMLRTGRP